MLHTVYSESIFTNVDIQIFVREIIALSSYIWKAL